MTHDNTETTVTKPCNTWHIPTATWLLFLLLLNTLAQPYTTALCKEQQQFGSQTPCRSAHHHAPDNISACHNSRGDHLKWAKTFNTSHTPKPLEPKLVWSIQSAGAFRPISEFRRQAVEEILQLVKDMEDVAKAWLTRLPPHASVGCITQVPVFAHPLRLIQYPQADILERELRRVPTHGRPPAGHQLVHPYRARNFCSRDHQRISWITTTGTYSRSSSNPELMTATRSCRKK